jgi:hypothetical protein
MKITSGRKRTLCLVVWIRCSSNKEQLFSHLGERWQDLFRPRFEVLLHDLTSTYFESDPPFEPEDKSQFGYTPDKRPGCV